MTSNIPTQQVLQKDIIKSASLKLILDYYFDRGAMIKQIKQDNGRVHLVLEYKGVDLRFMSSDEGFRVYLNPPQSAQKTSDKLLVAGLLDKYAIPTPKIEPYRSEYQVRSLLKDTRLIIKPSKGSKGEGVAVASTFASAIDAVHRIQKNGRDAILQTFVEGEDYRLLFVGYNLVAVLKRIKPFVIGDGAHTIRELITQENMYRQKRADIASRSTPWRKAHASFISLDAIERSNKDLLDQVPQQGKQVTILDTANISTGALCEDVTDMVGGSITSKYSAFLRSQKLRLCGIDVMSKDISDFDSTVVIELNSNPGLLPHVRPEIGRPRPVEEFVAEEIYKKQ